MNRNTQEVQWTEEPTLLRSVRTCYPLQDFSTIRPSQAFSAETVYNSEIRIEPNNEYQFLINNERVSSDEFFRRTSHPPEYDKILKHYYKNYGNSKTVRFINHINYNSICAGIKRIKDLAVYMVADKWIAKEKFNLNYKENNKTISLSINAIGRKWSMHSS